MAHFTPEYISFFNDLAANNYREWFHENKKRYEAHVKNPFQAFIGDIIANIQKEEPDFTLEVKNALFRINRDIRFSKDKTPYKLHMAAVVSKGGRKRMDIPGIYVHLGSDGVRLAGGGYKPSTDHLKKIRTAIVKDPESFRSVISDPKFKKICGGLYDGEKNKILPKEFKEYGDSIPELFNKQYFFMLKNDDVELIHSDGLMDYVMSRYKAGKAFNDWLEGVLF